MQVPQTLCPYTNQPLASIERINEEHVLPVAIGAPTKFFVIASESENSRLNELIDAPFSNDQLIRFLAMSQGVVSRSGPVIANLPAILVSNGDALKTSFSLNEISFRFANPVVTDPATGKIKAVKGFGDAAKAHAQRVKKDHAKKKISIDIGESIITPNPKIHTSFSCDTYLVQKELLKIAYLMTVWCFGDSAINSESGEVYRLGLATTRDEEFASIGMKGGTNSIHGISCKKEHGTHVLLSMVLGRQLVTSVTIFGIFSAVFITSASGISAEEYEGFSITIDLLKGTFSQTEAIQAVMANAETNS